MYEGCLPLELLINVLIILFIIILIYKQFFPVKGVKQIDTDELRKLLGNKRYQFIDVRTPYEFNTNNIKGFKNIPLQQLKERHHELSKEKEIVIICQSGMRSNRATRILKKLGYTNLTNVKGGMSAWS